MKLANQIKEQLAAKALKKQLERISDQSQLAMSEQDQLNPQNKKNKFAEFCRFDLLPGYQQVEIMHAGSKRLGVESPFFRVHDGIASATTEIGGKSYINYANYNYLGLSGDPDVSSKAKQAIDQYGTSASASRMVAGERPIQRELEHKLADTYQVDDCLVFVSGHATNVTVIGALCTPKDLIIHDALAHNSIIQGAILSGAKRLSFPHNDWQALDTLLGEIRHHYQRVLVVIEGLYSMDGDFPDLPKFIEIKRRHAAWLMVDEAHSFGVLGDTGKGIREYFSLTGDAVDIWMGTLSKSLASCGGYIAGPQALIDFLRHLAPGFLYSVGLAPTLAASALAALNKMLAEPERTHALRQRSLQFLQAAQEAGLDTGKSAGYSVIPIITRSSLKAAQWTNALFAQGINVQPIFYPAVEEKLARLRFFMSSVHTQEQIDKTISALEKLVKMS